MSVESCDYDIIVLTETWLNSSIHDSELFNQEYLVYRCDRNIHNSIHEMGGGVLIAVRSSPSISSERIIVENEGGIEIVFVRIALVKSSIYICCLYIPSGSDNLVYDSHRAVLNSFLETTQIEDMDCMFVMGDFNLPMVDWTVDENNSCVYLPTNVNSNTADNLLSTLLAYDLSQVNSFRNNQGKLLDLVFSNCTNDVILMDCNQPLSKIDVLHVPIEIMLDVCIQEMNATRTLCPMFRMGKADYISLNRFYSTIDWETILNVGSSCDEAVDSFYGILHDGFERFVPKSVVTIKNHPVWYNQSASKLKNRKNKAYIRYKKTKTRSDYVIYNELKQQYRHCLDSAYTEYLRKTQSDLIENPANFWSYVSSKRKTAGFPSTMTFKGRTANNLDEVCHLFASFFGGVYTTDEDNADIQSEPFEYESVNIGFLNLSQNEVRKSILSMAINKGGGPDKIPPKLLVNCADSLSFPLYVLFNRSLSSGIFPSRWKVSHITPIHKSGSRKQIENYRGVSIQATIGKLFESIVCSILNKQLIHHITIFQNGFFFGRSVSTDEVEFANYTINEIESGRQVDVLYTDFRKAFDRVSHSRLIKKLNAIGVHSVLLEWIRSYLVGRIQYVRIGESQSETFSVSSGVPQGSHLGPLLFILFMNDVPRIFEFSKCLMYADDLKIFRSINCIQDATRLQFDLESLAAWCNVNRMELNVAKCKCMSFYRKRDPLVFEYKLHDESLERVTEVMDLGFLLDTQLNFNKHIEYITARAYGMLGFVMRTCSEFKDPRVLKVMYYTHVRSIMEFGAVVWYPNRQVHIDRIESIQKRFVWFVFCKFGWQEYVRFAPYQFKCELLCLETLAKRRRDACALFVFDVLSSRINSTTILSLIDFNVPHRQLRNYNLLRIPHHRTDYGNFEPVTNMMSIFNGVCDDFDFNINRAAFRQLLKPLANL